MPRYFAAYQLETETAAFRGRLFLSLWRAAPRISQEDAGPGRRSAVRREVEAEHVAHLAVVDLVREFQRHVGLVHDVAFPVERVAGRYVQDAVVTAVRLGRGVGRGPLVRAV